MTIQFRNMTSINNMVNIKYPNDLQFKSVNKYQFGNVYELQLNNLKQQYLKTENLNFTYLLTY